MNSEILDRSGGFINWDEPIDTGVRVALISFFSQLTDAYTFHGRTYNLRSLLRRHLDEPTDEFFKSISFRSDAGPISTWGTKWDLRIDKELALGFRLQGIAPSRQDARVAATVQALCGLGFKLSCSRKPAASVMLDFEFCECCDEYSEFYSSQMLQRTFLGRRARLHPRGNLVVETRRKVRFCKRCSSDQGQSLKAHRKAKHGASLGEVKFKRLLLEEAADHRLNPVEYIDVPRFPVGFEDKFKQNPSKVQRTLARIISQKPAKGRYMAESKIARLRSLSGLQDAFVGELLLSLVGADMPDWVTQAAGTITQVELSLSARDESARLEGYGQDQQWISNTTRFDLAAARQVFSDTTAKLAITPRQCMELDLPDIAARFILECEENLNDERYELICIVERPFQYEWLLDYFQAPRERQMEPRR